MLCKTALLKPASPLLLIENGPNLCCRSVEEQGALIMCPNAALCRQVWQFEKPGSLQSMPSDAQNLDNE